MMVSTTFSMRHVRAAAMACLCLVMQSSFGNDTPSPSPGAAPDKLATVRQHVAAKQWPLAIDELNRVNDTGSADWNNLMGYSLRKATPPDLAGAEKFYTEALRIDPKHKGALEYSGELSLSKGDLPGAEKRLAALDKICLLPCEEYTDLKKAVERFKANNK
jgi:Flp pilus assembly protein TadD